MSGRLSPRCGVADSRGNSYGPFFNDNEGGWYATNTERTDSFIEVWSRNDNPPGEFRNSNGQINTNTLGELVARDMLCA